MDFVSEPELKFNKSQIAIAISPGIFGGHLGIVFESAKEGAKLLHLRFHTELATEPFGNLHAAQQCWIATVVDLPEAISKVVVGMARAVSRKAPSINFGIDLLASRGSFQQDGRYRAPKGSLGLTCASFVYELFAAVGVVLVDASTWREEDGFETWKRGVIKLLEQRGAAAAHVEAVRNNKSRLRLRPEQLAAASALPRSDHPAAFDVVAPLAGEVSKALQCKCPVQVDKARGYAQRFLES